MEPVIVLLLKSQVYQHIVNMPLYEHYCTECDTITENVCKIVDRKQFIPCPECGGSAERIISSHIERVEPTWLPAANVTCFGDSIDSPRPEDRNAFKRECKKQGVDLIS